MLKFGSGWGHLDGGSDKPFIKFCLGRFVDQENMRKVGRSYIKFIVLHYLVIEMVADPDIISVGFIHLSCK